MDLIVVGEASMHSNEILGVGFVPEFQIVAVCRGRCSHASLSTFKARYVHEYNSGVTVMGTTNYFLVEVEAWSTEGNLYLLL